MIKVLRCAALCCYSTFLLSAASPKGSPSDLALLKKIREHWKEGDFTLAKKEIGAYLASHPHADLCEEFHLVQGDLYLQEGNFAGALAEYQSIERKSLKEKALYNTALCLYEEKQIDSLQSLCQTLDSYLSLPEEHKTAIYYLTALALWEQKQDPSFAIACLENCLHTPKEYDALLLLSSLYEQEHLLSKQASCYLSLSKLCPQERHSLLFSAAQILHTEDKTYALSLWKELLAFDHPLKGKALYNALTLCQELQQIPQLITLYTQHQALLPLALQPAAHYLYSQALFAQKNYNEAYAALSTMYTDPLLSADLQASALWTMLSCCYEQRDLTLYAKTRKASPPLPADLHILADLHYIYLLQEAKKWKELADSISLFLSQNPLHPEKHSLEKTRFFALYHQEDYALLQTELSLYPTLDPSLLRLRLNAITKQLSQDASCLSLWIEVAQQALTHPTCLSKQEQEYCRLSLAKNLFLAKRFEEASQAFALLQTQSPPLTSPKELDLLHALCYQNLEGKEQIFLEKGEAFLAAYPDEEESSALRVYLFNVYASLAKKAPLLEKNALQDKAASHLFFVFTKGTPSLSEENIQWLGDYYYTQAKTSTQARDRAFCLLEHILAKQLLPDCLESNLYKISQLLATPLDLEKKITLLDNWVQAHAQSITSPYTQLQKHLLFSLAQAHQQASHTNQALSLYDTLIRSAGSSTIALAAMLEKCKLTFTSLSPTEKTLDNPLYAEVISQLKDLEVIRNLHSEPVHIEAGLLYIDYRIAALSNQEEKKEKEIQLLQLLYNNFSQEPEYQNKDQEPKRNLVDCYLRFAKHRQQLLQASYTEDKTPVLQELQLLQKQPMTPPSLQERITETLRQEGSA